MRFFKKRPIPLTFAEQHCEAHGHPWMPVTHPDPNYPVYWSRQCPCGHRRWGGNTHIERVKNRDPFALAAHEPSASRETDGHGAGEEE